MWPLLLICNYLVPAVLGGSFGNVMSQYPSYFYRRVPYLTPKFYGSATSFQPIYAPLTRTKPDCNTKGNKDVTHQSGTTNVGALSHQIPPIPTAFIPTHKSQNIAVPIPGFHFPTTALYPSTNPQPPTQATHQPIPSNSPSLPNSFHQLEQFARKSPPERLPTPSFLAQTTPKNSNPQISSSQTQSQDHIIVNSNINITASNLYQIPGMEHLKNCVPIPGTDGACVLFTDDSRNEEEHTEAPPTNQQQQKAHPPSKELIYSPTKAGNQPQLNFKSIQGNQQPNSNNYFNYDIDDPRNRNPNYNLNFNQKRPGGNNNNRNNNNNNNNRFKFPGQNNPNNFPPNKNTVTEVLPIPQAYQTSSYGNAPVGVYDKQSEGSEKVPGQKVTPPSNEVPVSQEFYMQFLRLWSLYHKRYGCSFKPTLPNGELNSNKRSIKPGRNSTRIS